MLFHLYRLPKVPSYNWFEYEDKVVDHAMQDLENSPKVQVNSNASSRKNKFFQSGSLLRVEMHIIT
jgi:hypothetical protein